MNAISVGPLMLAADRAAALIGIFAFTLVAGMLARRVDPDIRRWSFWALVAGIVAARVGHVAIHWDSFKDEPLRAFAVWQGGFFWPFGLLVALAAIPLFLRGAQARLAALAPVAAGLFIWNVADQLTSAVEPVALPDTRFQALSADPIKLTDSIGRPMIINLWASWCPPCRREMPMLEAYSHEVRDVSFIFANQGEDAGRVTAYLDKEGLDLPVALLDRLGELGRHYNVPGLPATLFIDGDGMLSNVHLGEISRESLDAKLGALKAQGVR
ncbi:TlpA disulfide reductase family protein [Arvimicrobium flavum]|uniref:TlpA disulfide reductase family protein n=1 Tax=Arvimicrobium flavum TaxID=3393320 RepID=UPI00237B3D68|nr:TlpA disulfide reductase family protein [Mesorhizobium shangrilense]